MRARHAAVASSLRRRQSHGRPPPRGVAGGADTTQLTWGGASARISRRATYPPSASTSSRGRRPPARPRARRRPGGAAGRRPPQALDLRGRLREQLFPPIAAPKRRRPRARAHLYAIVGDPVELDDALRYQRGHTRREQAVQHVAVRDPNIGQGVIVYRYPTG